MTSIDIETLLTIIYVLVEDWYQAKGHKLLKDKAGAKPVFSDSEVITLALAMDFIPFPGETQFLGYNAGQLSGLVSQIAQSESVQPAGTRLVIAD